MRLVDADALLKRKGCVYDSEGHVLFAVGTGDIVHAPTIDAIPVEWMREKMNWADDNGEMNDVDCISWLIQTWQKEQEAQDG